MTDQPFDFQDLVPTVASQPSGGRFRLAVVQSVEADWTISVTIAGSSTVVSGVKYLGSLQPVPGFHVWLVTDGLDVFALGQVAIIGSTYAPRAERSTNQTIATGTETYVSFNSAPTYNYYAAWSAGDPTKLYAKISGVYMATATVGFNGNATGYRRATIESWTAANGTGFDARVTIPSIGAGAPTYLNLASGSFWLQKDDYVRLSVLQNSGGNLDIGGTPQPNLTLIYLGP